MVNEERQHGLSIIIPCLNEEKTIAHVVRQGIEALRRYSIPGEVLVVDNDSADGSVEAAITAGARVVHEPKRGYGRAYSTGVRNARYEFCLKVDADGSYDPGELDVFWQRLCQGDCDIVLGSRFKGDIRPGAMPALHRYFGTPVLTLLINLIYGARLSDINSGMRAFRVDTLLGLNLRCGGMEFASEMLVKAIKKDLRICEIPITLHPDLRDGRPHLRSFRDGWRHLRFILLMSPLGLFLYPGLVCMLSGLVLSLLLLLQDTRFLPHAVAGWSIFGLTSFACVQNLLILGGTLTVFSYISKLILVQRGIDLVSPALIRFRKQLTLNLILLRAGMGLFFNLVLTAYVAVNLYRNYLDGQFTPFFTKLGMFNFTVYVLLILAIFSGFFISGFEDEE